MQIHCKDLRFAGVDVWFIICRGDDFLCFILKDLKAAQLQYNVQNIWSFIPSIFYPLSPFISFFHHLLPSLLVFSFPSHVSPFPPLSLLSHPTASPPFPFPFRSISPSSPLPSPLFHILSSFHPFPPRPISFPFCVRVTSPPVGEVG